jgi:SAM-dependent methyltransferase
LKNDIADFYDDFVENQLDDVRDENPRLMAIRRRMRPILARRRPAAALDVGCGVGVMSAWLARSVPRVVGVDISPRSIDLASKLWDAPDFVVSDLPAGPLPPGEFDLVTMFDVLEHVPAQARLPLFRRVHEVCTEDAIVAINIPSKLFARSRPEELAQIVDEAVGADEVVALASAVGMEPLCLERYGIDSPNQYVFCAFSRRYEVEGGLQLRLHEKIAMALTGKWRNIRSRRVVARLSR